jgi:hypothetical protein
MRFGAVSICIVVRIRAGESPRSFRMRFNVPARTDGLGTLAVDQPDALWCDLHRATVIAPMPRHRAGKSTTDSRSAFTSKQHRIVRRRAPTEDGQNSSLGNPHRSMAVQTRAVPGVLRAIHDSGETRAGGRRRSVLNYICSKQSADAGGVTAPRKHGSSQSELHRQVILYTLLGRVRSSRADGARSVDSTQVCHHRSVVRHRLQAEFGAGRRHHTGRSAGFRARQPAPVCSDRQALSRRHRRVAAFAKAADGTGTWPVPGLSPAAPARGHLLLGKAGSASCARVS